MRDNLVVTSSSSPIPEWRVHHFAVSTPDLEATAAWYRDTLGFEDDFGYEVPAAGMRAVFLRGPSFRLEIFTLEDVKPQAEDETRFDRYLGVQGLKHIALGVEDLDAATAWLRGRDADFAVEPREVPDSGGERFAFIQGPDGVLIEFYEARHHP
jgi:catechol 2,3-dioxygenase-like lactoylglutathione lyase family enzyme